MVDPNSERLGKTLRKHVRIEASLVANLMIADDADKTMYTGVTRNLSSGGLCLEVSENKDELLKAIGSALPELKVSLYLSHDSEALDVHARTAWIHSKVGWLYKPSNRDAPILMGMEFGELRESVSERINGFIADILVESREQAAEQEDRIPKKTHRMPDPSPQLPQRGEK